MEDSSDLIIAHNLLIGDSGTRFQLVSSISKRYRLFSSLDRFSFNSKGHNLIHI